MSKLAPLEFQITTYPLDINSSLLHFMSKVLDRMRASGKISTSVTVHFPKGPSFKLQIRILDADDREQLQKKRPRGCR